MRRALYEPELGYYERTPENVGRRGDFYTSVSVGSVFGELLAAQLAEWVEPIGPNAQWVEAGAHAGQLAEDILTWLRTHRPAIFDSVRYLIIEPSIVRQSWQRERLLQFSGHVDWATEIPSTCGVIFSNELLDAFPVRPVRWDVGRQVWDEIGVTWSEAGFRECRFPRQADTPEPELPRELLSVLPDGFTTETSPTAEAWWQTAALRLQAGCLVTIDYGLIDSEYWVPQRHLGTRRGYRQHRLALDLLADPGKIDLTAHVHFSRLIAAGERTGLSTQELLDQRTFLTRQMGRTLAAPAKFGVWTAQRLRQFQTLTHPEHLGRSFRVLVQERTGPSQL